VTQLHIHTAHNNPFLRFAYPRVKKAWKNRIQELCLKSAKAYVINMRVVRKIGPILVRGERMHQGKLFCDSFWEVSDRF
jgi:hypothetical protein